MATKYPRINVSFPTGTDTEPIKRALADTAKRLGYVSDYHKSVERGSIGLLLEAIALGEVKVVKQ